MFLKFKQYIKSVVKEVKGSKLYYRYRRLISRWRINNNSKLNTYQTQTDSLAELSYRCSLIDNQLFSSMYFREYAFKEEVLLIPFTSIPDTYTTLWDYIRIIGYKEPIEFTRSDKHEVDFIKFITEYNNRYVDRDKELSKLKEAIAVYVKVLAELKNSNTLRDKHNYLRMQSTTEDLLTILRRLNNFQV